MNTFFAESALSAQWAGLFVFMVTVYSTVEKWRQRVDRWSLSPPSASKVSSYHKQNRAITRNAIPRGSCAPLTGSIPGGLVAHPDGRHIVYPLGCTLIVHEVATHAQSFLSGHTNSVSCLTCSPSGTYLASGQVCPLRFTPLGGGACGWPLFSLSSTMDTFLCSIIYGSTNSPTQCDWCREEHLNWPFTNFSFPLVLAW